MTTDRPTPGDNLLDLDLAAPERFTILIRTKENPDGTMYEFRDFDELSLEQQGELAARGEQLEKIRGKSAKEFNAEIGKRLALVLDAMLEMLLPTLPEDIRERLDDNKKVKIVETFTEASPQFIAALNEAKTSGTAAPAR